MKLWIWTVGRISRSRLFHGCLTRTYASSRVKQDPPLPHQPLPPFNHPIQRKRLVGSPEQQLDTTTASDNEKYTLYPKGQLSSHILRVHRANMDMYPDCLVITKVGGFYELYFEQAVEYGPILNLRVARKRAGVYKGDGTKSTIPTFVPMAGFPSASLERYLKMLVVDLGRYVAISEEVPKGDSSDSSQLGGPLGPIVGTSASTAQFDRIVTRIVTPGTLIDEKFMDPYRHNYLVSISIDENVNKGNVFYSCSSSRAHEMPIGLAWVDLSTGDFITQQSSVGSLTSHLVSIGPSEVVIDGSFKSSSSPHNWIYQLLKDSLRVMVSTKSSTTATPPDSDTFLNNWQHVFEPTTTTTNNKDKTCFSRHEILAAESLLEYVQERLPHLNMQLQTPQQERPQNRMLIDSATLKSLEIYKTMQNQSTKGSFISTIQRTTTQSGARLLADRITSPSMSISEINRRLDLVEVFVLHPKLRFKIVNLLKQTHDCLRLVQKLAIGRGDEADMVSLAHTFNYLDQIVKTLMKFALAKASQKTAGPQLLSTLCDLMDKVQVPRNLADRILATIDERVLLLQQQQQRRQEEEENEEQEQEDESLATTTTTTRRRFSISPQTRLKSAQDSRYEETFRIKPNASDKLKFLHRQLDDTINRAIELEKALQTRYGAGGGENGGVSTALELKYMAGMGYVVCVTASKVGEMEQLYKDMHLVRTGSKTKVFQYPEWSQLGQEKNGVVDEIKQEEMRLFGELRKETLGQMIAIRKTGMVMDEIDISCGFALLAIENDFVRPVIEESRNHEVIGGRHPTVEASLASRGSLNFVGNDCVLEYDRERVWVITGPNMAGKSTFLRQNGLIVILGQTGSFVPCQQAKIGIVDRLFSRVGSGDNLYMDQSTFMVEMLEVSGILTMATDKSFVIMDEVGRGTTSHDGLAIAYASLEHICRVNKCRGLFATHFHNVGSIMGGLENIGYYCTDIVTTTNGFYYEHKLKRGINRESHALKVAHLAGMPPRAIETAKQTAHKIQQQQQQQQPLYIT